MTFQCVKKSITINYITFRMASILFLISSSSSSLAFSPNREEMLLRTLSMSGKILEEFSRHSSIISKSDFLSMACGNVQSLAHFDSSTA